MAPRDGEISAEQRIESVAGTRNTVVKAYEIGRDYAGLEKAEQQSEASDDTIMSISTAFARDQIEPPYSPDHLCKLFEHSASLRQNVDAYMTNIDGFGHTFDPVIQLKEAAGRDMVRDAIFIERYEAAHNPPARKPGEPVQPAPEVLMPTDADIEARIDQLRAQMRMERARVESFFSYCVAEESFTSLRRRTRQDIEVTGNGYWEVIRNGVGEISQFVYIPSRSMRVTSKKPHSVEVPQLVRFGSLAHRKETFRRKFRRYLQTGGDHPIWFKEFGDPQILSSRTGKSYDTLELLQATEHGVPEATEVFHFKIHALTTSAYGVPRWIGNLLSVLGSRAAEEVNLAYFDNKAIPPMAILVSGGRLGEESVKRIEDFVEVQIKGRKNFHKILVIEAETTAGAIGLGNENAGHMRVEIKTLTDAQLKDGLFLAYDSANMDKVGMGFRLPRLLRGDIRDFNRASAEAALDFAESQVFGPERNDFDFAMNRHVLPALGIHHWQFKSNGPRLSDSQSWGDMIVKLTVAGILTPEDARALTGTKVLSQELPLISADWIRQPLPLTIAGVQLDTSLDNNIPLAAAEGAGGAGLPDTTTGPTPAPGLVSAAKGRLLARAKDLIRLRDAFRKQETAQAVATHKKLQAAADAETDEDEIVIRMTAEELATNFGITRKET